MSISVVLVSVARALLAVVIVVAGAAKLADTPGFQQTLRGLGAPGGLVRTLSLSIPSLELGVGLLMLTGAWTSIADALLLALTSGFLVTSSVAVLRRVEVECRCFGQLGRSTFHLGTVRRAGGLFALSIAVVVGDAVTEKTAAPSVSTALVVLAGVAFAAACAQATRALELVNPG
jgi:DoxX